MAIAPGNGTEVGPRMGVLSDQSAASAATQIIGWADQADQLATSAGVDVRPVTDAVRNLVGPDPAEAARELISGNPSGGAPALMARAEQAQAELNAALGSGGQAPAGDQVLPLRDEVREAFAGVSQREGADRVGAVRATVTRLLADGEASPMANVLTSRWAQLHFENLGLPGISDLVHGELAAQRAGTPMADLIDHFGKAQAMGSAAAGIARRTLDAQSRDARQAAWTAAGR